MHNNIMAASSKDRPPMLGQEDILSGVHLTSVVIEVVAATVNSPEVPQHDEAETVHNMSTENKLYFQAEKEAIFLLLTGIGDEIYSTVDACNTANKMWIAIESYNRLIIELQEFKTIVLGIWEVYFSRWRIHGVVLLTNFTKLMNELTIEQLCRVLTMQVMSISSTTSTEFKIVVTVVKHAKE
ncbi:hypothetical protein Tco_0835067 [Tanacetum coccineum]